MASRLYWVTLVVLTRHLHTYATRYQSQMSQVLSPELYQCVVDLIAALASCLAAFGTTHVDP